jgi:hypothetical protein
MWKPWARILQEELVVCDGAGAYEPPSRRQQALQLRRQGLTYQAIQDQLGVAKSTVWLWLKAEGLVQFEPQRQTELRQQAQRKATAVVKARRLERTAIIVNWAKQDIGALTQRELQLVGAALYWAEGAKQKEKRNGQVSEPVLFSNSDPRMHRLFIRFLHECCDVSPERLRFRIYPSTGCRR